jgi:hypothetical protein
MREEFILAYIPERVKQLGFTSYHIRYRDFFIASRGSQSIDAWNELYFLVGEPLDILIDSDYGQYNSTISAQAENTYQHKGNISISNTADSGRRVKFIQVILVN